MNLLPRLLRAVADGTDPGPFALLHRDGADHIDVIAGDVTTVDSLADIPLAPGTAGPQTLALVPYRQIAERGFDCVDDGAPLECLRITAHESIGVTDILAALPDCPVVATGGRFDIGDDEYGDIVAAVLRDEIGRGEGANFVIHRTFTATLDGDPLSGALAALRRLLTGEQGAYWTFLVHTGTRTMVGATPERHVSVVDGLTMMNPISGTFRHRAAGAPAGDQLTAHSADQLGARSADQLAAHRADLLAFLADPKEIDELYMVLDEELKMMAAVAEHGGQVVGPYLKEMAHLTHTEYLLAGHGSLDVREVLRATMFAPTVTGSPIENACRVIARHERRGRGYYAGVLALLGHDEAGRQTLDAPILIRTAEIDATGALRVPVGATLVRHSTAAGEVAETHTKAAGVLAALGLRRGGHPAAVDPVRAADDPAVQTALAARNTGLARFWLDQRRPGALTVSALAGRNVLIIDAEDTFTAMLAHQLRALGLSVTLTPWHSVALRGPAGYGTEAGGPDADQRHPYHPHPDGPPEAGPHPNGPHVARPHVAKTHVDGPHAAGPHVAGPHVAGPHVAGPHVAGPHPDGLAAVLRTPGAPEATWPVTGVPGTASAGLGPGYGDADLVVVGPGPGDPADLADLKMRALRAIATDLLDRGRPMFGVCLGHQVLAGALGLPLLRRDMPYQGLARDVDLFGVARRVGFYSSFTAVVPDGTLPTPYGPVEVARDPSDGTVHALRGRTFAGVQFHPESVLSADGLRVLTDLLPGLLAGTTPAVHRTCRGVR